MSIWTKANANGFDSALVDGLAYCVSTWTATSNRRWVWCDTRCDTWSSKESAWSPSVMRFQLKQWLPSTTLPLHYSTQQYKQTYVNESANRIPQRQKYCTLQNFTHFTNLGLTENGIIGNGKTFWHNAEVLQVAGEGERAQTHPRMKYGKAWTVC